MSSIAKSIIEVPGNGDVLLGRGNGVNLSTGNAAFRVLVDTYSQVFARASSSRQKREVAEQIIREIESKGGRFLRRITYKSDDGTLENGWEVVEPKLAKAKALQALRDRLVSSRREDGKEKGPKKSKKKGGAAPVSASPQPLLPPTTTSFSTQNRINRLSASTDVPASNPDLLRNLSAFLAQSHSVPPNIAAPVSGQLDARIFQHNQALSAFPERLSTIQLLQQLEVARRIQNAEQDLVVEMLRRHTNRQN